MEEVETPKAEVEVLIALLVGGMDLNQTLERLENHLVDQALERTGGNKNRAAILLGLNRTTMVEKLRKRGLITPRARSEEAPCLVA